ncbi:MAG TPA: hypothetical protein PK899_02300, partial [Spirochaetota bacterium]|nr:hypothetical protein [Spirochaetota bacterium]
MCQFICSIMRRIFQNSRRALSAQRICVNFILAPYDAKVKVLIKSAKAVIIEPSLVKYDERLLGRMSFELV